MPTYAYKCADCQHELELFQKIVDAPITTCPQCGKETLRRGPGGGVGLLFAGGGWYKDGYGASKTESKGECCPCGKNQGSCKTES